MATPLCCRKRAPKPKFGPEDIKTTDAAEQHQKWLEIRGPSDGNNTSSELALSKLTVPQGIYC